jgi:predicted naringenin-chalcone synthase
MGLFRVACVLAGCVAAAATSARADEPVKAVPDTAVLGLRTTLNY